MRMTERWGRGNEGYLYRVNQMLVEFHSRGTMNDDGAMGAHKLPITVAHAQFLLRNIPGNCNKPFTEVVPTFPQA